MSMHAVHKILARASEKDSVLPGEIINAKIDIAGINDIYLTVLTAYDEMNGQEVWNPNKIVFFFDHNAPCPTETAAYNHKEMRSFVKKHDIKHLFEINEGVCHMVLPEAGLVKPGNIIIITDSHTTTHGVFGAFATGVGSTDLAAIMITGELWLRVPEVVKVKLEGRLKENIMAKDIAIYILGELGTNFALYRTVEFCGEIVDELCIEERMVLCNMAVEMGAKSAYIKPDEKAISYLRKFTDEEFYIDETDSDFIYEKEYSFNLNNLEPQVSMPHSVDNTMSMYEIEDITIDQVFIGSCTGGKLEDLKIAAKILEGKKISKDTRLIVTPASKRVLEKSIELGYYKIFLDAGAAITTPGCGACLGGHSGILADGEHCATTSNRNFPGRMGSLGASLYLVSPVTAAATAISGKLTHPDNANKSLNYQEDK